MQTGVKSFGCENKTPQADLNYLRLSNYSPQELTGLKTAFGTSGWQGYWRRELEMQKNTPGLEYV